MGIRAVTPLAGVRVLVVDDDRETLEMICTLLEFHGATVTCVDDGVAALAALGDCQSRFDLMLCDIAMPGMDGYELLRRLRAKGCTVPVLAHSAHAGVEHAARARAAGFFTYLEKPVPPPELVGVVAAVSNRGGRGQAPDA
jgi:two-component system CheB/CheR fusion protein